MYHLPFRCSSKSSKLLKKECKVHHRARARRASDRFLSTELNNIAQAAISSKNSSIAIYDTSEDKCCADTGATETILNDYKACTSYRRLFGRYATLGDDTKLKIEGLGSAVHSLNGKVIKSLHIPQLQGSFYSLLCHRMSPGCGVFSSYEVGSYLFFPNPK